MLPTCELETNIFWRGVSLVVEIWVQVTHSLCCHPGRRPYPTLPCLPSRENGGPSNFSKRLLLAITSDSFTDRESNRQEFFFHLIFPSIKNSLFVPGKRSISLFIIFISSLCTLQSWDKPLRYNVKLLVFIISKERYPKVLKTFLAANKRKKKTGSQVQGAHVVQQPFARDA